MFSIKVFYQNQLVGLLREVPNSNYCVFRYSDEFIEKGIELCPILMPLEKVNYVFQNLSLDSFKGLPPLLADSLPDRYGSELLLAWQKAHNKSSLSPLEALSYIGRRGMGALEFAPSVSALDMDENEILEIDSLAKVADEVLNHRKSVSYNLNKIKLTQLISVGSSIGGARAKAIVAIDKDGNVKSGQISGLKGCEYCIIKFDGLKADLSEDNNTTYYTRIEYAYYLMAISCGIIMTPCSLIQSEDKYHFKTIRFDRDSNGNKIHMLSLAGLVGYDYKHAGENSYEEVASMMVTKLGIGLNEVEQLFRRMVFNVVCKNHDDHIKNISFLMDKDNKYHLSPAYDLTYSYNPFGDWTRHHQMTINNKIDDITYDDLIESALNMLISKQKAIKIINEVINAAKQFYKFAEMAHLPKDVIEDIYKQFTLLDYGTNK